MSRERLQQAVQELADRLYESLRAELRNELLAELRGELKAGAPPAVASLAKAARSRRPSAAETLAAKIVAWVTQHPRSTPGAIQKAVGGDRKALYQGLAVAREAGQIVKEGSRPKVWYSTPRAALPMPKPHLERPAVVAPDRTDVLDRVVAFVGGHPAGCAPRDMEGLGVSRATLFQVLPRAVELGLIAKTGNRRSALYHPPGKALATPPPDRAASTRPAGPLVATGESLVEQVIAFVREHAECRYGEIEKATGASAGRLRPAIQEARTAGAIRMVGEKIKSRYFPVETPPTAAPAPVITRSRTIPPPTPVTPPVPPRTPASPSLDPAVLASADALLRELDEALEHGSHDIRLGAVLQAIVAEVRQLQSRVPGGHSLAHRLDGTIRRITAIRAERNLPFITGLKRGATADWSRLSRDARQRIAQFDLDAEAVAPARKSQRPPRQSGISTKSGAVEVERLPRLLAIAEQKSIVLVGGIKKNEVLEQVRRHYALELEWAAMQGANARAADAVIDRIRHGNVGAVVVLEALTGTTQIKSVVAACKDAGVPFAYGGAAGTESLRSALQEIERNAGPALRAEV